MDKLLRMQDVAKYLDISTAQAYKLARLRQIPSVHFGRSVRVPIDELERFIANRIDLPEEF